MPPALRVIRPHEVVPDLDTWVLTEEHVPESSPHDILSDRIKHLLIAWAERAGRNVKIGRNLALRWDRERPQLGLDPDVYLVEPPPPEGDNVMSLLLWKVGHHPPFLAIEVVSPGHPFKDYRVAPTTSAPPRRPPSAAPTTSAPPGRPPSAAPRPPSAAPTTSAPPRRSPTAASRSWRR